MFFARLDNTTIDKARRSELLAYAALTGAYIAIWKGYYVIVPRLIATVKKMVTQAGAGAPQSGTSATLTLTLAPFAPSIAACSLLLSIATRTPDATADSAGILIDLKADVVLR